jgi:hypothetical protein
MKSKKRTNDVAVLEATVVVSQTDDFSVSSVVYDLLEPIRVLT